MWGVGVRVVMWDVGMWVVVCDADIAVCFIVGWYLLGCGRQCEMYHLWGSQFHF